MKIVKNVEITLAKDPRLSKVIVDGKVLPVGRIEIKQSMDDLLEARLSIFPDKVLVIRDSMKEIERSVQNDNGGD